MLDTVIMKQPLLFLESGSTLVLEQLEVKGAAAPSVGAVSLPTTLEVRAAAAGWQTIACIVLS